MKRLANEGASKKPKVIHLLVNSAEIARDDNIRFSKAGKPDFSSAQAISKHFMQSELEKWSETFQTNLTALFSYHDENGRKATPGFSSSIVNVASITGVMNGTSSRQFAYAASKVRLFTNHSLQA